MEDGTLDHPLEAGRGLGLDLLLGCLALKLLVDEALEIAREPLQIDAARLEHGDGVGVLQEREQQVFERRELVPPLDRQRQRAVEAFLKIAREHGYSFSIVHCNGCSLRRAKLETCFTLVSATS